MHIDEFGASALPSDGSAPDESAGTYDPIESAKPHNDVNCDLFHHEYGDKLTLSASHGDGTRYLIGEFTDRDEALRAAENWLNKYLIVD